MHQNQSPPQNSLRKLIALLRSHSLIKRAYFYKRRERVGTGDGDGREEKEGRRVEGERK